MPERHRASHKNRPRLFVRPPLAPAADPSSDPQLSVPSHLGDPTRGTGKPPPRPVPSGRTRSDNVAHADQQHGSHAAEGDDGTAEGAMAAAAPASRLMEDGVAGKGEGEGEGDGGGEEEDVAAERRSESAEGEGWMRQEEMRWMLPALQTSYGAVVRLGWSFRSSRPFISSPPWTP